MKKKNHRAGGISFDLIRARERLTPSDYGLTNEPQGQYPPRLNFTMNTPDPMEQADKPRRIVNGSPGDSE